MTWIPLGSVLDEVTTTGSTVIDVLGLLSVRLYDLVYDLADLFGSTCSVE